MKKVLSLIVVLIMVFNVIMPTASLAMQAKENQEEVSENTQKITEEENNITAEEKNDTKEENVISENEENNETEEKPQTDKDEEDNEIIGDTQTNEEETEKDKEESDQKEIESLTNGELGIQTMSEEDFSVSVDVSGYTINTYLENDIYYLFIPRGVDISNLAINYTGEVTTVSSGTLDVNNKLIINNFENNEMIQILTNDGKTYNVKVMQSDLPSMCITLNGVTLDEINNGSKDTKYKKNKVEIVGAEEEQYNITDNKVTIKGRGNSTWKLPKKPYQIKFDSEQGVLGMNPATTWILLANYWDETAMRNKAMFDLSRQFGLEFSPDYRFIDLFVDGQYLGNYLICEKVEVGENRVDFKNNDGILVELDNYYGNLEDYYFKSSISNTTFVLKDSAAGDEDDGENSVAVQSFEKTKQYINKFETLLYAENPDWDKISKMIDVESFAKYYILQEISRNTDACQSSAYFYQDGENDVLHAGPIWDFDIALGNALTTYEGLYIRNVKSYDSGSNDWFTQLFRNKEFEEVVRKIIIEEKNKSLSTIVNNIQQDSNKIQKSLEMNFIRWPLLSGNGVRNYESTYEGELNYLKTWLSNRITYLEDEYINTNPQVRYSSHIQDLGWEKDYSKSNGETSGTTGQEKRLEAIKIKLDNIGESNAKIKYSVHVQDYNWMDWKENGQVAGTQKESRRIEAIKIQLEGLDDYSVKYRVHVQDIGWTNWAQNGEVAGTTGQSKRVEAIEIKIVKNPKIEINYEYNKEKNTVTATITSDKQLSSINDSSWTLSADKFSYTKEYKENDVYQVIVNDIDGIKKQVDINITQIAEPISMVKYSSHIQEDGWEKSYSKIDGETSGTIKQSKRLEAIQIALGNSEEIPEGASIEYQVHVQYYNWMDWKKDGEIAGTTKESKRIEAIKIKLKGMDGYSAIYRTHVQDIGWTNWVKNGEISGTTGQSKRVEAIEIKIVKNPKLEVNYTYNQNDNTVTATITSDKQLSSINDNSWTLSPDKLSYSKKYDVNDKYNVIVKDIDGIEAGVEINITQVVEPISNVKYSSHIQEDGWEKKYSKIDGETSGTTGEDKRLEAIQISLGTSEEIPEGASIRYKVHVQYYGWMDWKQNGEIAGTTGEGKRIEAIQIELQGMEGYCVEYRTYIEGIGWQKWKSNGEISGTIGEAKRVEAIQIKVVKDENKTIEPSVQYQVYVQKDGWQGEVTENTIAGTTGKSEGIQALKIDLKGANKEALVKYRVYTKNNWQDWVNGNELAGVEGQENIQAIQIELGNLDGYSIEYRVHISDYGWQKWRKDGEIAGIVGNNIEAIQIRVVYDKSVTLEPEVSYQAYVQEDGWQEETIEGLTAGTEKQSKRLEAIKINLMDANSKQKIKYRVHVQELGWQPWVSNGAMAGTTRQSKRIEAIQIKLENIDNYTVEYQVHVQDYGWSDWMIDGETAGTTGESRRIEAIRIRIVPKYYREYKGIDVSEHNGRIDWQSVKNSGVQFAMIRCAYRGYRNPVIVTDKYFDYNVRNATAVGIKVGIYFFSQATSIGEAVEEANYAINLAKQYGCIEYPIAIDTEYSGAAGNDGRADGLDVALRTNVVAAFCNQVNNSGYEPMVYASKNWLYNNLEVTRLSPYETWLAHYTNDFSVKSDYKYNYTMWQYTSKGSVAGIGGNVDLNIGYKAY